MSAPTDIQILETMRRFGGGFASHLALAALHADDVNRARIKRAFPDLFIIYETMAQMNQTTHEEN